MMKSDEEFGMKVYAYTRVSTGRQVDDGESLDVQSRTIEGYCLMKGLTSPIPIREEGVSGSKPFRLRPAGSQLLNLVKPGDIIVAAKLDRMFRSSIDALAVLDDLSKRNVGMHLIDLGGDINNDMVGKLVFTILSAVAEAERMRIQERIRDVKTDQKKRGRYLGGPVPFGWKVDDEGYLVEEIRQQKAISDVLDMRTRGMSYREIVKKVEDLGVPISYATVRRIANGECRIAG